jgi:hypothetical protein
MDKFKRQYPLMKSSSESRMLLQKEDKCDKYDYLAAVACGALGGMIDIFLVGAPGESVLSKWTDKQVDNVVMSFARKLGWNPREKNLNNVKSAIGFLEHGRNNGNKAEFQGFRVNYDQDKPSDVNNLFTISTKTHHMMSLAHSPDIIGLFFSILNQFTSTSSFVANGGLVTIATDTFELKGGNFVMKIMCGIANWFGYIMSDIAGSSGAVGRGSGVVIPFYEIFNFCKFGSFSTNDGKKDLAEIAMQAFTRGYDFRFGLTQAIPLVVTELLIRLIWALRQRFQFHKPIKECIPTMKNENLRVMLLLGNGTLCVMDGVDAGICSGGNFLAFFMRLNIIAWFRFTTLVIKEVCIRVGLSDALSETIVAFRRVNEVLLAYLNELEKIDIKAFKRETQKYKQLMTICTTAETDKELNRMLLDKFDDMGWDKPWNGNFDEHMSNRNGTLIFK